MSDNTFFYVESDHIFFVKSDGAGGYTAPSSAFSAELHYSKNPDEVTDLSDSTEFKPNASRVIQAGINAKMYQYMGDTHKAQTWERTFELGIRQLRSSISKSQNRRHTLINYPL